MSFVLFAASVRGFVTQSANRYEQNIKTGNITASGRKFLNPKNTGTSRANTEIIEAP
jgi:hypothetical protein